MGQLLTLLRLLHPAVVLVLRINGATLERPLLGRYQVEFDPREVLVGCDLAVLGRADFLELVGLVVVLAFLALGVGLGRLLPHFHDLLLVVQTVGHF